MISDLNQQLLREKKWCDLLSNSKNKCKLIDLIVGFILGDKDVDVNSGDACYHKDVNSAPVRYDVLYSTQRS